MILRISAQQIICNVQLFFPLVLGDIQVLVMKEQQYRCSGFEADK